MKGQFAQKGIGPIGVLISAVVFAVGITAVVQLHGTFFKSSSVANAMSIAEEKIEDLRGFQVTDSTDGDIFDFTSILANGGGHCTEQVNDNKCSLAIPSGIVNKDNISFNRSWTVTDYYYNGGALTTSPSGDIDQKKITVTVTWTDNDGSPQVASLSTVINKFSGASSTGLLAKNIGGSGEKPVVPYTPSTEPRVTPIGVGTDTKQETMVPSLQTVDGYSRTKFIAYTYSIGGTLVRQEEFQNVACDCVFDGTGDANNKTYAAAHHVWNAATDTYIDVDGDLVSDKVKGRAIRSEPLCDICCRDHHDSSSAAFKFDPFRSGDDYTSGDHKHYHGTSPVTSGQYLEACRLKRVNGNWRVFEDWNLIKISVLTLSDLTDNTTKAIYTAYVQDLIDEHLDESKVSGEILSSHPVNPSAIDHTVSGNYITLSVGDKRELTGRGVYLDYIDSEHLTKIQEKKSAGLDYLLHLPFYELEVAPVSNWLSAIPAKVRVGPSDGPGSSNDLIGGELAALASDASAVSVTGTIKKSNSGIVALRSATDYNAAINPDSATQSDLVNVCVGCTGMSSADCMLPWEAPLVNGSSVLAYQFSTVPFPGVCSKETRACSNGALSGSYTYQTCSVTNSTCLTTVTGKANNKNDTITLGFNGSLTDCSVASSKNYKCTAVTTAHSVIITVTSLGSVNSTVTISPVCGAKTVNF